MSSHRSHVARCVALGSTVDPLHGLISLGLVDWDGRNQLADSAIDGMCLAAILAEQLLTLHEEVVLKVSTLARQAQTLASSLDLLTTFHSERLGRLESRCFEMDREMGEMRVQMMELELAWERRDVPSSSSYVSVEDAGEEGDVMVGERMEEEKEVETYEDGLWSPNSSDCAILALVPDAPAFPLPSSELEGSRRDAAAYNHAVTTDTVTATSLANCGDSIGHGLDAPTDVTGSLHAVPSTVMTDFHPAPPSITILSGSCQGHWP
ncbi:hypothetical protein BDM02DRAFT_3191238 [Thelephora ganbajun]|uniref:Uncharacterized protein n=1 Tax=Thelephora ganbajun TaxID=370292 RepID=A0ACB6Z210_THEGA|nr:hypothetical protein BDM02DRAFT_3191238 [Thelephora ganbajun]